PSVLMVIYGIMTETHIGKLYAAGLVPGLLGIAMYLCAVKYSVMRDPDAAPPGERSSWSERLASLRGIWAALLLFVFVIGGIYAGTFTTTEAAGIGAFGAFVI